MLPATLQFVIAMIAGAINERMQHKRTTRRRRCASSRMSSPEAFTPILRCGGVECVKIPASSPNCNFYAERFVKTIKYECLNHLIFFGERHLRYVVKEFMAHYLAERFHQGIGGQRIKVQAGSANDNGAGAAIVCRSRLGGFLNYYHREAA